MTPTPDRRNNLTPDRRNNLMLRRLVILGNHLSMWAGIEAKSAGDKEELMNLFDAWDLTLRDLRTTKQNNPL